MGVRTEKEYEVHYYEVNYRLDCKMSSIINYFCDIGAIQSNDLGVGIDYLTERRLAWVFYKYDIKVQVALRSFMHQGYMKCMTKIMKG